MVKFLRNIIDKMFKNEKNSRNSVAIMLGVLEKFNFDYTEKDEELNEYYELTKRSLDEVTRLTEYQDEKANRILAALSFLSAFSGVIFYVTVPKSDSGLLLGYKDWNLAVSFYYMTFFWYVMLLFLGAAFVLVAIMPRFNAPKSNLNHKYPKSFLFYQYILEMTPEKWANSFCYKDSSELRLEYTKQNIVETYLISEKIRTKLNHLEVGVGLLCISVFCLLPWLVSIVAIFLSPVQ